MKRLAILISLVALVSLGFVSPALAAAPGNDTYAGGQDAWAYMWTLIPGFVGIGSILAGLLGDNTRQNLRHGFNSLIFSAVAFLIFASIFGGLDLLGKYGPAILLIGLGVWLLARSLWKAFSRKGNDNVQAS